VNKARWSVVVVGAFSVLGWLLLCQTRENADLRQKNTCLKQQLDRLSELEADNHRLSNLVAQADATKSNPQLLEVLRLRNEVGILRRQTNEFQQAQQDLQQLRNAVAVQGSTNSGATNVSSEPLAVYPKEQWKFAGYDTPENAFQSLNWAALNGDLATLKSNLTQEAQKQFAKWFENKSEVEIQEELGRKFSEQMEARILSKDVINDNLVVLGVSDGRAAASVDKLVFQKIDGQWKFVTDH
jgi:hypothetical protein